MTRISSLFVAASLAVLPIAAFAQQTTDAAKPATMNTAPATATTTKSDVKTPVANSKIEMHSLNGTTTHHTKTVAPTKSAEPSKS